MTTQWKAFAGVSLIFIFGFLSGTFCTSIIFHQRTTAFLQRGPVAFVELFERRLTHNLNLDENQRQQIHRYFIENLEARKVLQQEIQPRARELNLQTVREIESQLHPDQLQIFHDNIAQFRKRFALNAAWQMDQPALAPVSNINATNAPSH